ncbi:MAG: heavy metal-associated domain-containing protein [Patescibacteria group bacterium]
MHKTFTINGTHCQGCKGLLEDIIKDIPGVTSVTVDPQTGKTEIEHDETLDWDVLKSEVASAGHYQVAK